MTEHLRHEYRAYLWTLLALMLVYFGTMGFAAFFPNIVGNLEAFGMGTVTGGLIGLMRTPRQAHPQSPQQPLDLTVAELPLRQGGEQ